MAAAEVSGIAALIAASQPDLDQRSGQVPAGQHGPRGPSIRAPATRPTAPWEQGAGLVNAPQAVFTDHDDRANTGLDLGQDLTSTTHYWGYTTWDPATSTFQFIADTGRRDHSGYGGGASGPGRAVCGRGPGASGRGRAASGQAPGASGRAARRPGRAATPCGRGRAASGPVPRAGRRWPAPPPPNDSRPIPEPRRAATEKGGECILPALCRVDRPRLRLVYRRWGEGREQFARAIGFRHVLQAGKQGFAGDQ